MMDERKHPTGINALRHVRHGGCDNYSLEKSGLFLEVREGGPQAQ